MFDDFLQVYERFDALTLTLIALAAFGTAMFHSISGFAGGLLLAIVLAPLIGVKAVVPVMAVALLVSHTSRTWVFRRGFDRQIYWWIMRTGFPGIILGAAIYSFLPVDAIAVILGLFLITMVPLRRLMSRRNLSVGSRGLATIGVPFGVLSGSTIGAGMMLAPFMLGAGVVGERLLGTMAAIALTVNVTKAVVFGGMAVLDPSLTAAGILVGLFTIPGNVAGHWVVTHTPIRVHIILLEAVIVTGGCYFVWSALRGFGWLA